MHILKKKKKKKKKGIQCHTPSKYRHGSRSGQFEKRKISVGYLVQETFGEEDKEIPFQSW